MTLNGAAMKSDSQTAIVIGAGLGGLSAAMRLGAVSVVAPFRYTRLPFGLLVGVLFFGEKLTTNMIAGTCVVVASGLYIWLRESHAPTT